LAPLIAAPAAMRSTDHLAASIIILAIVWSCMFDVPS
jgi:hypothetical protein